MKYINNNLLVSTTFFNHSKLLIPAEILICPHSLQVTFTRSYPNRATGEVIFDSYQKQIVIIQMNLSSL